MNLLLKREILADTFTLGTLYCDGQKLGYTCEDKDRKLEEGNAKVYGETAIPRGKYPVITTFSHRFKRVMPEVLGVRGFDGIRIHGGNTEDDTLGCPLLGAVRTVRGVANCADVNKRLVELIEQAEERNEKVWLTVE